MAAFNPDVPKEQPQHYWYWSRPIEPFKFAAPEGNQIANTSLGTALRGAGDVLESGAKAADAVVSSSAKFESEQASREIRAQESAARAGDASLVSGDRPDQGKIAGDLAPLGTLKTARANGQLSETGYWARVDAKLSDIRSRYPIAYRDDIDNASAAILGQNAANALLRSRTADINAALSAQNAQNKAIMARGERANDDGVQYAGQWARDVVAGKMTPEEFDNRLNAAYKPFYDQKLKAAQVKELMDKGLVTQGGQLSLDNYAATASQTYQTYWDEYNRRTGLDKDPSKANNMNLTAQQARDRLNWLATERSQYKDRMLQIASEPRPELGGRSYLQVHGEAALTAAEKPTLDRWANQEDILNNPNYGAIHRGDKLAEAAQSDVAQKAFQDPKLQHFFSLYNFAKDKLGPDMAQKFFEFNAGGMPNLSKNLMDLDTTLRFGTGPEGPPRTVQQSFEQLQGSKVATPEMLNETAHRIVDVANSPTASPEAKQQAFRSVYDPSNSGFIGILDKQSQLPMYNLYTSKKFVDEVHKNGGPQDNANMENWTNTSFRNLVGSDVKELGTYQNFQDVHIMWYKPEGKEPPKFGFTLGNSKSDVMTNPGEAYKVDNPALRSRAQEMWQTFNRINAGIVGLSNVYRGNHDDVERSIFEMLHSQGFDPDPDKVTNLPEAMVTAIHATRQRAKETEQEVQKLQGK